MPYRFTCPHCQTKTEVEDRFSGQSGRCVTCGEPIQLPHFAVAAGTAPATTGRPAAGWIIASAVAVILLACLLIALVRMGRQTMTRLTTGRERNASLQNLERIAAALNAYAADHGSYPLRVTRDSNNNPLHSWRVLILPYLGEEELYSRFDLTLAWDSPHNMQAAGDIPAVYQHPSAGEKLESSYYVIAGPGTLFPAPIPLGPDQISDDPSQTILVIEGTPIVASGLWTEPVDLDAGNLRSNPGIEPGGLSAGGVAFATSDGRGHFVPDSIDPLTFRSLITPRGGERLADDTLD
jgi:hypothetical protein